MSIQRQGRYAAFASFLIIATASAANSQDTAMIQKGNAVFQHTCAPCHGYGPGNDGRALLPAPTALTIKYRGKVSPFLEERSDLSYPVLLVYVRRGSWSMPGFRKTEVTDMDVQAIAAYLAESARVKAAAKHAVTDTPARSEPSR